ncbi:MAG: preprotein translocase subunit SecA [Parachlamydiales bacterium]
MLGILKKIFGTAQDRQLKRYWKIVHEVNRIEAGLSSLSDDQLRGKTAEFRKRLAEGESLDALLPEAYAVVKNACRRQCGAEVHVSGYDQKWDMIPYDVQLLAGIAMHHGCIAEMQTGEGKTLTATLPLYLNALAGGGVHLVTVNDYLAQRDCQWVGSILRWLGLTTGALTGSIPPHHRKEIYAADVVYGTASEFGFDYLRDNSIASRKEDQVQRSHTFAIVDEIDSILIDEARTPLIISGPVPDSRQMYGELKHRVEVVVRAQKALCSRLATEAKKVIDELDLLEERAQRPTLTKEQEKAFDEALKKLWLVSRGTPYNRILKRIRENPDLRTELDKLDLYYHSESNKEERSKALAALPIVVDEKANDHELTDKGIEIWTHEADGSPDDFVMLDLGHAYYEIDQERGLTKDEKLQKKIAIREEDALRKERAHNLNQMLRAHLLMERDVDYMVADGKIIIIDEHTGRAQPGRRFSDGLHQAIEAKENVAIQQETQTYATVTLQNLFRMYDKLSGMTGTAMTEAGEFKEIYKLDVLEIPTHVKCQRKDTTDEIYMTEREKYQAILAEVTKIHAEGRPILLGTESLDISEKLSRIFRASKLPHTVLNAKYHDKEAEIVAQAGQRGAITIATNMAGRGTDIKLGSGVAQLGGLFVIGASRHQSRRIDRQLRGRCARQGDPGSSKFYVSFEDPLMRLFSSSRINLVIQKLRPPEGEAISSPMLDRSIQTAQKRVEQRNYMVRKHTLEYDDVMNRQRTEVYAFRNELLHTDHPEEIAKEVLTAVCGIKAEEYHPSIEEYLQWLREHFPITFTQEDLPADLNGLEEEVATLVTAALDQKLQAESDKIEMLAGDSPTDGAQVARDAIRSIMLRSVDQLWQEHLLAMDHLRTEVSLRTVGQKDPLMEFKHEAFALFDALGLDLRTKIATDLFRFEVAPFARGFLEQTLNHLQLEKGRSLSPEEASPVEEVLREAPVQSAPKAGRNDLCPCGSGKKYKRCCGLSAEFA